MQRALLASALVLGSAVIGLAAAAFVAPPEDLVEPSNAKLNFGHETTYDSFAPIHYPEHGIFVLRHQSWRMSVYLDRDPTSACLLEWVPAEEVALVLGGGWIRWPATEGVFHDPVLGTYYSRRARRSTGPGGSRSPWSSTRCRTTRSRSSRAISGKQSRSDRSGSVWTRFSEQQKRPPVGGLFPSGLDPATATS